MRGSRSASRARWSTTLTLIAGASIAYAQSVPTTEPAPAPAPAPAPTTKPKHRKRSLARVSVTGGKVTISTRCRGKKACRQRLTVRVRSKSGATTRPVATRSVAVRPGRTATVRTTVDSLGRKALSRGGQALEQVGDGTDAVA